MKKDINIFLFPISDVPLCYRDQFISLHSLSHGVSISDNFYEWKLNGFDLNGYVVLASNQSGKLIGLNIYGSNSILVLNRTLSFGLVLESCVHPDYRSQGIFSKMASLAAGSIKAMGYEFLLSFPNVAAKSSYLRSGFKPLGTDVFNFIRPLNFNFVKNLLSVSKPFVYSCNINKHYYPKNFLVANFPDMITYDESVIYNRFSNSPYSNYLFLSIDGTELILRQGFRGKLAVADILTNFSQSKLDSIVKAINSRFDFDILSFSLRMPGIDQYSFLRDCFIGRRANFGPLVYTEDQGVFSLIDSHLIIRGLDFHTY